MSQIFTLHSKEICEFCNEEMVEIGLDKWVCPVCRNQEDNF